MQVLKNRLCWFGHVQRMEGSRIPKRVLYMNLGTTRSRGGPRNRWQDEVRDDGQVYPYGRALHVVQEGKHLKTLHITRYTHIILSL